MSKPQIRFKGFEEEWPKRKVESLGDFIGGGTPSSSNEQYWSGHFPWISSSDTLEEKPLSLHPSRFISNEAISNSATRICQAPVILIVSRVGVGKVSLGTFDLCTSQDFTNIVNLTEDPTFSTYGLAKLMKLKSSLTQGTSIKGINSSEIKNFELFIPCSKYEQKKIGDYFKRIDEMIAEVERDITRLEKMKQASLQKMFPRPGQTTPEIRFAGFTEPWRYESFNTIITTDSYKPFLAEGCTGKYPIIQQGENPIAGFSSKQPYMEYEKIVVYGDHTTSVFKPETPFLVASDGVKLIWSDKISGLFLSLLLKNYGPKPEGYKRHFTILETMDCVYPTNVSEQKAIGEYFRNLDSLLSAKRQKLVKLRNIRQACLDKMFVNSSL